MERKYAVITGFLGKTQDRFCDYQPPKELEEMVELAAGIKGCSGIEVVYPQNLKDCDKLIDLLKQYKLGVSTVNLNVKSEEKFRFGSFSNPDEKIRKESVAYLKTAMDYAAELGCNLVTSAFLTDGSDYPFELDYIRAFQDAVAGVQEAAEHRSDVRISLEYKASEPRAHILSLVGIKPLGWFSSVATAKESIVLMALWKGIGYNVIIFFAGLQSVPVELYEAGTIDGTNEWQKWFYITIPSMKNTFTFVIITTCIGALKRFSDVYAVSGEYANPANSILTIMLYIYRQSFSTLFSKNLGMASAASVVLFGIIMVITVLNLFLTRDKDKALAKKKSRQQARLRRT